jgi:hypothetical protein
VTSWPVVLAADVLATGWALALLVGFLHLRADLAELERRIRWMETHAPQRGETASE